MKAPCKDPIRKQLFTLRNAMSKDERQEKSLRACQRLMDLPAFAKARAIHAFVPFRSEIDTRPVIKQAWKAAKKVALPKVVACDHTMRNIWTQSWDQLEAGYMGIPEPKAELPDAELSKLELIVVPGAAFDRFGGRMGYGGGFYDRFMLQSPALRVGFCFDLQVIDAVPHCAHDLQVDLLVTDERVMVCETKNQPPCYYQQRHPEDCPFSPSNHD